MSALVGGIDIALACTGVALADVDETGASWRTWQVTSPTRGTGTMPQARRINDTADRVIAATFAMGRPPALVVVEAMPPGTFQQFIRDTAGQWWAIVGRLVAAGVPVATVNPATLKVYALGHGGSKGRPASKKHMVDAARAHYPGALDGGSHDVADAIHLAGMGARHLGLPVDCLPDKHIAAMAKAKWPNLQGGTK